MQNGFFYRRESILFLLALTGIFLGGCHLGDGKRAKDDELLASVYNKELHFSDMTGMIPPGQSSEDSSAIINTFIRNWVRESVLLYEAERNIPQGLNIEKLVEDYRSSLIKNNYENIVVTEFLDSTVTQLQLQGFYDENKEQYQLEVPIIRCRFIKVSRNAPQINKVQSWWNSNKEEDFFALSNWCRNNATIQHLTDSIWYKVEDIAAYMPAGVLTTDNVKNRGDFIQRDESFVYFFKLLELVSRNEIAPLAYIEDQAKKVILHKRKMKLLEELKNKLQDEAIHKNRVNIYYQ